MLKTIGFIILLAISIALIGWFIYIMIDSIKSWKETKELSEKCLRDFENTGNMKYYYLAQHGLALKSQYFTYIMFSFLLIFMNIINTVYFAYRLYELLKFF